MKAPIGLTYDLRPLTQINLNHLVYFWAVARSGSVTAGAAALRVSQSAVSEQLRTLEGRLGTVLMERTARGVRLTPAGERAQRYAEEIIGVCSDLVRVIPLKGPGQARPLIVGTADSVPKVVVRSLLSPILQAFPNQRIVCKEWQVDHLLSELSLHRVDFVLSDAPVEAEALPNLSSLSAGGSSIVLCATQSLAKRFQRGFPRSLDGAPFLLPATGSPLRRSMDRWFGLNRVRPRILVEAEDRSQLHHFGESGYGIVPVAEITASDLKRQFGLLPIGVPRGVREEYFAIVMNRQDQHESIGLLREHLTQTHPITNIGGKPRKKGHR